MKFTTSLFSQILQVIPRVSFSRLVHKCGAERHAKGFSSWDQFVAMLFCQLAQAKSLREISDGLGRHLWQAQSFEHGQSSFKEYPFLC